MRNKNGFKFVCLAACMLAIGHKAYSQTEVIADGRLQNILEKHVEYNRMAKTVRGFRINVATFTGDDAKNKAFSLKNQLLQAFPDQRVYVLFDEPNFNVRLGDYPTRLDAYSAYIKLKNQVSTALIIQDYINLPALNKDDLQEPEYFEDNLGE
ncbi:MAG: hypothetical protein J6M30_05560 [Bacteroidales bacterium]|nr:hypothetical protein [Bacteroidales bacterium]